MSYSAQLVDVHLLRRRRFDLWRVIALSDRGVRIHAPNQADGSVHSERVMYLKVALHYQGPWTVSGP